MKFNLSTAIIFSERVFLSDHIFQSVSTSHSSNNASPTQKRNRFQDDSTQRRSCPESMRSYQHDVRDYAQLLVETALFYSSHKAQDSPQTVIKLFLLRRQTRANGQYGPHKRLSWSVLHLKIICQKAAERKCDLQQQELLRLHDAEQLLHKWITRRRPTIWPQRSSA